MAEGSEAEQVYTLAEAGEEIARRQCLLSGHSWQVIETSVQPITVICSRCGKSHQVVKDV